ncbi:hypothetical protein FE782_11140 [Paenibacillus antri]|uniref:TniQ family protein n=1 Tax=Paenibacillus antri TaxID=2582848 RepID=A0A5R9GL63_9BACL|nr:TniQ family protein [Paenibacillus antri]TLS52505.1 hypothetical protein FE782_11140 [Paenibacillus antri]
MTGTKIDYHYTWRKEWISPYESLWGILEKFKFANSATVKDIFNVFGTDYVKNLKTHIISKKHRECIHLSGLDGDLVESVFLQPIIKINERYIEQMVGSLPRSHSMRSYIRDELYFCPECIKTGHHSLFHQFKLLHECPYHQIPLHKGCVSCKKSLPFELSDNFTKEPFRCLCGQSFLEEKIEKSYLPAWNQVSLNDLRSIEMITWLNFDGWQLSRLKSLHFPLNLDLEECSGFMDYVLSVLNPEHQTKSKEIHTIVKSAPYIRKLKGEEENGKGKSNYILKRFQLYDVVYESSVQTVQSIASYVKKSILGTHRSCLERLFKANLSNDPICPYALAYAHWMKFVMGYENLWIIKRATHYRKYPSRIEFGSKQDDYYLTNLFYDLRIGFLEESFAAVKWIFNRLIGLLIWNHFMNWLSVSQESSEKRLEYRRIPFKQENVPFYILVIPDNKNEPLEYHWWGQKSSTPNLVCPFSSRKSNSW